MTVTAPDVSVWWDAATVTAAALAQLRLVDGDVDAGRVDSAVDPAGQIINNFLDRDPADPLPTPPPEPVEQAHVTVVINLYRNKDAPPSGLDGAILGAWTPTFFDPLAGVRSTLAPYRRRYGVG